MRIGAYDKWIAEVTLACSMLVFCASLGRTAELSTRPADFASGQTDGGVAYSHSLEGYAVMSFAEIVVNPYSPPPYCAGTLVADAGAADSPFAGDYSAAGVTGLTFRIMSDGHKPASAMVILQSSVSGRIWINENVPISGEAGRWVDCAISLARASGWRRGGTDLDAKWAIDLRSVGTIGIRICQGGTESQVYTIADFMLAGASGPSQHANLSALQKALLDRFGVTTLEAVSEQDKKVDSDLDGMTDVLEILSIFDLDFANLTFVAELVSVTDQGVALKWPCVQDWKYTVFRSERLGDGFFLLPDGVGVDMVSTNTGYMVFTDTDSAGKEGPFYYRVLKRP